MGLINNKHTENQKKIYHSYSILGQLLVNRGHNVPLGDTKAMKSALTNSN